MTWLVENPWPLLLLAVLLEAVLAIVLVRTGHRGVLGGMLAVFMLAAGAFVLERVVITETEEVEATLDQITETLVTNDLSALLEHVSPTATQLQSYVKMVASRVTISEAKITSGLKITINRLASPPTAVASFRGRVRFADTRGTLPGGVYVGQFTVLLRKEGDRWLAYDYEEMERTRP